MTREELEQMKQEEPNSMSPSYEYIKGWNDSLDAVIDTEPKQGEWIDKDYGIGKCWATCSECGESTSGEAQDYGFGYDYSFPNYCPQCGADMGIKGGEAE